MTITTSSPFEAPSRQILVEAPERAFSFLRAAGTSADVRAVLEANGYTQADHEEGWSLLLKASCKESVTTAVATNVAAEAIRMLDEWDEPGFHKAHAALMRKFPAQAAFLFQDLAPTQGPSAMLGVARFLDRLDALEKSEDRKDTRDEDKHALEVLAVRGITTDERLRLRKLIEATQTQPVIPMSAKKAEEIETKHMADLLDLYAWYSEWTEVAHAVVDSRGHRIALGVAKRKPRKSKTDKKDDKTSNGGSEGTTPKPESAHA